MPAEADLPSVEELLADLRVLRARGLVRLRHTDLPCLQQVVRRINALNPGADSGTGAGHRGVETVLSEAIENLGGGELASAAQATFGLDRGSRDRPAHVRRSKAADVYGVSEERFRKYHEKIVLEQVAEEILKLCVPLAARSPAPPSPPPSPPKPEPADLIVLPCHLPGISPQIFIHVGPVELIRAVDILVVPSNTYLELPQYYKSSISAAARRMAIRRSPDGLVVEDVVAIDLAAWIAKNARPGLAVAPGTVAVTSSGEMTRYGIRRLYHVAVVTPQLSSNDYEVEPSAIADGVRHVFATANAERSLFSPALSSIAFPLLGAGRGGLDPVLSFRRIWATLEQEVTESSPWQIHFLAPRQELADLIVSRLAESAAIDTSRDHFST